MNELKRAVSNAFKEYKLAWIEEFSDAKKQKRKFSFSNVARQDAEIHNKLDNYFIEAEERLARKITPKKGWLK